eukprot:6191357-Pleurochrysis_carterae.AAC.1
MPRNNEYTPSGEGTSSKPIVVDGQPVAYAVAVDDDGGSSAAANGIPIAQAQYVQAQPVAQAEPIATAEPIPSWTNQGQNYDDAFVQFVHLNRRDLAADGRLAPPGAPPGG